MRSALVIDWFSLQPDFGRKLNHEENNMEEVDFNYRQFR